MSDDGRHAITVIAFLGSVFSPFYVRARRESPGADPLAHCALNVAVYGPGAEAWAFTERGRDALAREAGSLRVGGSSIGWEGDALVVRLDEKRAPGPGRVRGTVRLSPTRLHGGPLALDPRARHRWWSVAPHARVEVALEEPELRFAGSGYHDANEGDEGLEDAFTRWSWSRAELGERHGSVVLYDVERRDGSAVCHGRHFRPDGRVEPVEATRVVRLPETLWRLPRETRTDRVGRARVVRALEDAPFYARSLLRTTLLGREVPAIHESLSLDRFRAGWVRFLLPFRMRRGWRA